MQDLNVEQNTYNQKLLFCQDCLAIPHFSIEIESNGNIFLCHLCNKNKVKKNIELFVKEDKIEKRCYICDSISSLACIKCNLIICEKCLKSHNNIIMEEEDEKTENNQINIYKENEIEDMERENTTAISILELQFICKKHIKRFSHYCQVCKKNLCDDCLMYHEHMNNIKFEDVSKTKKEIESFLKSKGDTQIVEKLLKISKLFAQCFNTCKTNETINIDIILNYWLIKGVKTFIEEKKERGIISNKFVLEKGKSSYSKYFYDQNFILYYDRLILDIHSGNINSFHSLNNIKAQYQKNKEMYLYNYELLKISYQLRLSALEMDSKFNVLFVKDMIQTAKYNYSLIEMSELYEELNLQNKIIEYNFALLKRLSLEMIYKLDYQLRRKSSNLITKELYNHFYQNIQALNTTKNRLSKCSSELKSKLISLDKIKNKTIELTNYRDVIKSKYIKSLELIKNHTANEIQSLEFDGIKEENNDIIFINLNEEDKEYLKAVLFNLFMIIRKELHTQFNNSIHNEIQNINSLLKDEYKIPNKNSKEKNKKNHADKTFEPNKFDNNIKVRNAYEDKEKNIILCKVKSKIIENIEKYAINDQKLNFPDILDIFSEVKVNKTFSQYSENEFVKYLEESQKLYTIPFESNVKNSLYLYLKGDKSNLLCEKKIYHNMNSFKNDLDKIKNTLEKNEKLQKFVSEIIEELISNLKNVKVIMSDSFECLEEYSDIYNIKSILQKLNIKIPFNPMAILLSQNNTKDFEQRHILKKICVFLILKDYIEKLRKIKNKIKELNITKLDKEIKLKIKIIDYFQSKLDEEHINKDSFFENIWNTLKYRKIFVDETSEQMVKLNRRMKAYVNDHSCDDFINDFDKCVTPVIKKIDFSQEDPQDLDVILFMKQKDLWIDENINDN